MNSPEISHKKGFTLVELLLTVAIVSVLGGVLFPLSYSFFQAQLLDETREGIAGTLRYAGSLAIAGKRDAQFGVKILPDSYVMFEGDSYAARTAGEDLSFPLPSSITITGPDEIVFSEGTGVPSESGAIGLTMGAREVFVYVGEKGTVQ